MTDKEALMILIELYFIQKNRYDGVLGRYYRDDESIVYLERELEQFYEEEWV